MTEISTRDRETVAFWRVRSMLRHHAASRRNPSRAELRAAHREGARSAVSWPLAVVPWMVKGLGAPNPAIGDVLRMLRYVSPEFVLTARGIKFQAMRDAAEAPRATSGAA